jgi:hypothetical protein
MSMPDTTSTRSLLFGLLALEVGFLKRDALVNILQQTSAADAISLEDRIRGSLLTVQQQALLDALLREHLANHQHDLQRSLTALGSLSVLRELGDNGGISWKPVLDSLSVDGQTPPISEASPAPSTRPPAAVEPLPSLPRFCILRPLAAGGLGQVFIARDEQFPREVALK